MVHVKPDIYQTDYSIYSKLGISPYSEVINGSTTFKPRKGSERLKKNDQLLNLMFCSFFHFLRSNVSENKFHKHKLCVLQFTRIKLVARVLARACVRTHQMEKTAIRNNFKVEAMESFIC